MALSVAVAVGDIADPRVEALAVRLPKLVLGAGSAAGADMGRLITSEHRDRVASYVEQGAQAGATVVVDGRESNLPEQGFFLGATLLDRVTTDMAPPAGSRPTSRSA